MCPSSCIQLVPDDEYCTDEAIIMSLFNFKTGKPLPLNVTPYINPYQYKPSDLPAGLWYLSSGVKKEAEYGFWQETEAAHEIFSNSVIIGSRTTLRWAPHERKTDWVMQEYRISNKYDNDMMDVGALCRVFLADENRPSYGHCSADINVKISVSFGPKTVSTGELVAKTMENKTTSLVTRGSPDRFLEMSNEMGCILKGDYLELNDLVDPGSRSSSSSDSRCLTRTSEEYFDSMALLQQLQDDIMDQEIKDSNVKFNVSEPVKSKEVVLHTATSGSLKPNKERKPSAEETSKIENSIGSFSNGVNNEHFSSAKRRKMMKYLYLLVF